MDQLIQILEKMLAEKDVSYRFECYTGIKTNPDLWRQSAVTWDPITGKPTRLIVYYRDKEELLCVLSHEIGHVMTTNIKTYEKNIVQQELKASKWGLRFLYNTKCPRPQLERARKRLQECLNSYCDYAKKPKRRLNIPCSRTVNKK